jgi:hypothetical protein
MATGLWETLMFLLETFLSISATLISVFDSKLHVERQGDSLVVEAKRGIGIRMIGLVFWGIGLLLLLALVARETQVMNMAHLPSGSGLYSG